MVSIEWRTPRSVIESKFQRIQKLCDEIGVVIFNEVTWQHEDSPGLTAKKIAFERFLDDAQKMTSEYVGDPGSMISLHARYLYDTKDYQEKELNNISWRPVLPAPAFILQLLSVERLIKLLLLKLKIRKPKPLAGESAP